MSELELLLVYITKYILKRAIITKSQNGRGWQGPLVSNSIQANSVDQKVYIKVPSFSLDFMISVFHPYRTV